MLFELTFIFSVFVVYSYKHLRTTYAERRLVRDIKNKIWNQTAFPRFEMPIFVLLIW